MQDLVDTVRVRCERPEPGVIGVHRLTGQCLRVHALLGRFVSAEAVLGIAEAQPRPPDRRRRRPRDRYLCRGVLAELDVYLPGRRGAGRIRPPDQRWRGAAQQRSGGGGTTRDQHLPTGNLRAIAHATLPSDPRRDRLAPATDMLARAVA